jgi:hypothetical protein
VSSNYFLPTLYDVADLSELLPSFKDVPGLSSSGSAARGRIRLNM